MRLHQPYLVVNHSHTKLIYRHHLYLLRPVVDLQRASMTAVNNLVDQQVASGSGGNIPIDYIAETNPTGGSHLSKHLTQPVSLSESAVGLKILIGRK